jgi:hypothetical protein
MDQDALNNAAAKGLPMPFAVSKSGVTLLAPATAVYKEQLAQTASLIFETISTLGEVKIDRLEIIGDKKGVIMDLDAGGIVGTIFESAGGAVPSEYGSLLQEMRKKPAVVTPVRRKVVIAPDLLEKVKAILQDYVGDFTERIFQNQMKNQAINAEALHEEDVRRLILALSRATGMIVGHSKGRELSGKLMELIK